MWRDNKKEALEALTGLSSSQQAQGGKHQWRPRQHSSLVSCLTKIS
jgi:hypothetical protein